MLQKFILYVKHDDYVIFYTNLLTFLYYIYYKDKVLVLL